MKIVSLFGSPRSQGNSSAIARRFLNKAESLGAENRSFALNTLQYQGCQACMLCKTKLEKCALKDDLSEVLDAIHDADILVAATPVYFADVSSQFKTFVDRCYSFLVPDFYNSPKPGRLSPGKKMVFILTQGNPSPELFNDISVKYDFIFQLFGFSETYLIRACGLTEPDAILKRGDILKIAEETAEKIML